VPYLREVALARIPVESDKQVDLSYKARRDEWSVFVGWNTDRFATVGLASLTIPSSPVTLYAIYRDRMGDKVGRVGKVLDTPHYPGGRDGWCGPACAEMVAATRGSHRRHKVTLCNMLKEALLQRA
jgi:hypothetical protein